MRNRELGRPLVRPLWQEADRLRQRVREANGVFAFFSAESALSQRAAHGHLRMHPAARAAVARLCASPQTRVAVLSARPVESLQTRLRLHRLAYVGVHGADIYAPALRLVTEPDRDLAQVAIARLRRSCSRQPIFRAPGVALEDRVWGLALQLRLASAADAVTASDVFALLADGEGLQLRRTTQSIDACAQGPGIARATLGLLCGMRRALAIYVGAGAADEEGLAAVHGVGGIAIHVGAAPPGTAARYQVDAGAEVIRLIHWLSEARRGS